MAGLESSGLVRVDEAGIHPGWEWLARYLAGEPPTDGAPATAHLSGFWGDKMILGVTGNIAVGKSTVLEMLETLGAEVVDADRVVHQLREPGQAGYRAIVALLGRGIVLEDGQLNTQELANRAFCQPDILRALEAIFAPLVGEAVARRARDSARRVVAVEAIRLLEGDLRRFVDQIWVVDAPRDQQIERLVSQRGLTLAEARARIDAQNAQALKLAQADVVIRNAGEPADTRRQVFTAWAEVLSALYERGWLPRELVAKWVAVSLAHQGCGLFADAGLNSLELITQRRKSGALTRQDVVALLTMAD